MLFPEARNYYEELTRAKTSFIYIDILRIAFFRNMDVFDLRYMRKIRFTLWTLGGWPSFVFEDAPITKWRLIRRCGYTLFLCVVCSLGMVGQTLYLTKNKGILEFVDLGQTCLTLLFCCVFVVSICHY